MLEKKYTDEEMNIELTSFLDNKQNIWFLGNEIATILGYCDTKKAIKQHVSVENKIIQLIHPNRWGGGVKRPLNKKTPGVNGIYSLMRLVFMNLY